MIVFPFADTYHSRGPTLSNEAEAAENTMNDDIFDTAEPDTAETLRERLARLDDEHTDLDDAIARLAESPTSDELLVRRMKKRKLALKDRIATLERLLKPNDLA